MNARRVPGLAVGLLVTYFLVITVTPLNRERTDRSLLLTAVLYAAFRLRLLLDTGVRPRPETAPVPFDEAPPEEHDVRLAHLDVTLRRATESPEQFQRATRPMLRDLAAERLRAHSGVDVSADPVGARRLMGEELWETFAAPASGPAPTPRQLEALVERLERL